MWSWPDATVVDVIDGDTLDMRVTRVSDIGFGGTSTTTYTVRLRLNRINATKGSTPEGMAATAYLLTLIPIGSTQALQTLKPYKYGGPGTSPGEWMAEITLAAGGNVSDLMVSTSHAVYWDGTGPRPD